MKPTENRAHLGGALRTLRRRQGWTLAEVSRRTGLSVPTLSKVENDRLSLSYDKLIRVSEGLGVDIGELFTPTSPVAVESLITGRRSINRRNDGETVNTQNYDYRYLSVDVSRKKLMPMLVDVHSRTLEEFGELVRHVGEEFIFVLQGEIELHTELYAPVILKVGESVYVDSTMGHAYLARGRGRCRVLSICSGAEREVREAAVRGRTTAGTARRPVAKRKAKRAVRKLKE